MLARDVVVYGALLWGQFSADLQSAVADSFSARYVE
jgi:hypothetical protein